MSTFNTPWFNSQNPNFFNSLNRSKTPHLVLAAETDDFDDSTIEQWTDEGFDVRYVPLQSGGDDFIARVHAVGEAFGMSEQYAIIAFGAAASLALAAHTRPTAPRLVALVAYYPTTLPSVHTRFPESIQVLVHLAGSEISVQQGTSVLGIQGPGRRVRKRIERGSGHGQRLWLPGNFRVYTYVSVDAGFAESDLEEYDAAAAGVAFARSLEVVRKGFRIEGDVEGLADRFSQLATKGAESEEGKRPRSRWTEMLRPDARVHFAPTLAGGIGRADVEKFYRERCEWPDDATVTLLSRTSGTDRVVDELHVELTHSIEMSWLLPGVPPTGKGIEMIMVVILHARGSQVASEHVYWDQASVLVQAGLLDPKLVPRAVKGNEWSDLPAVGVKSARGDILR